MHKSSERPLDSRPRVRAFTSFGRQRVMTPATRPAPRYLTVHAAVVSSASQALAPTVPYVPFRPTTDLGLDLALASLSPKGSSDGRSAWYL